jgi:hypothetical protein
MTLRRALACARRGWPGFPCLPGEKIPGRKNCPSGKLAASRCAACTAKLALPIPAIPSIALMPSTPSAAAMAFSVPSSRASSAWRPVQAAMSIGR